MLTTFISACNTKEGILLFKTISVKKNLYKNIRSEQLPESEGSLGDQYGGCDPGLNQGYIIRRAVL